MSRTVNVGTDIKQPRGHYWYVGTDTLYTGYALCFNDDFGTAASTSNRRGAEVEKPASTNLKSFAGVLAPGSNGVTGPCAVEVIQPNCIVDGYTSLSTTLGSTLLAINPASYVLSSPVYGGSTTSSRVVGVALQTIDRSSTNGLVQMDMNPDHYGINIGYGVSANNLIVGAGTTSGDVIPNMISIETAQTGGAFHALRLRGELAGAGSGTGEGGGIVRIEGIGNSTALTASSALSAHFIFKTGATNAGASETFSALYCKVENQDSTPAALATGVVCAARFVTQLDEDPGVHAMFVFEAEGSDTPDYFLTAKSDAAIVLAAKTSAAVSHIIKIKSVATDYWLMVSNAA